MKTDPRTIAVYNAKARAYANQFKRSAPGSHLRRFMGAISPGGYVLDLGCGPAFSARHMMDAGFEVDAVDASDEMISAALDINQVNVRKASFDQVQGEHVYNGIWANFSLLHVPQEELSKQIEILAKALKPGGVFHIGMKVGDGMKRDQLGRQYSYVSVGGLGNMIVSTGLEILACDQGSEVGLAGTNDPWVVMMAQKDA